MKRQVRFRAGAVAAWLVCAALPFYFLTRAQEPGGAAANVNRGVWVSNVNGNMNAGGAMNGNLSPAAGGYTNLNLAGVGSAGGAREDEPEPESDPAFSGEWVEPGPLWGSARRSLLVLRAGAEAGSKVLARVRAEVGEVVTVLEAAGDRLRVKVEANDGQGATRRRDAEGWVEWGAVVPVAEALVVEAASGEVLRRVPLEDGITNVAFAADGATAFLYGPAAPSVHEAGGDDLKARRAIKLDGTFAGGEVFPRPSGAAPFVPIWRAAATGGYKLDFLLLGEGPAPAVVPTDLTAESGGRFLVSDDGLTGFALYPDRAAWGGALRVAVAVFDLQTLTQVRAFVLPEAVAPDDAVALGRNGTELLALPSQPAPRLVVAESLAGSLLREVPLGRVAGSGTAFRQTTPIAGRFVVVYPEDGPDGAVTFRSALLTPEGSLTRLADGVTFMAEAGGVTYSVDDAGTRLLVLDERGRVRSSRPVRRREGRPLAPEGDERIVRGLFATPDGKRLVIIKGVESCGC
ncbi:MAG TPA: hypothetical protein VEY09_05050 [Pyrinomonadaceae bacterium]|nr:hypothetical protein [Pyrinomonadaceae bacterium]